MAYQSLPFLVVSGESIIQREDQCLSIAGMLSYQQTLLQTNLSSFLCFLPTFLCSAGVGRTGTFITIDMVLQQAEQEGHINIMNIINQLRHKRMKMVQTLVRNHILKRKLLIKMFKFNMPVYKYILKTFLTHYLCNFHTFPSVRSHNIFIITEV